MTNKEEFIQIFNKKIIPKIPEARELLSFIESTDFFSAPASVCNHSAEPGGLCFHSLNVYDAYLELLSAEYDTIEFLKYSEAQLSLVALCHDLCKINCYSQETRNVKVDGQWTEKLVYTYKNKFCMGHGAKSIYLIQKFIPDFPDELLQAIYYHMGGMDNPNDGKDVSSVYAQNPYALFLHLADMIATFAREKRPDEK